jgi:hypothetical protein
MTSQGGTGKWFVDLVRERLQHPPLPLFLLRTVLAIRHPLEFPHDRIVDHPVQQRHHQRWVADIFRPIPKVQIRHERRGAMAVSAIHYLIQQTGRLGILAPLQLVEAEFVNDQ